MKRYTLLFSGCEPCNLSLPLSDAKRELAKSARSAMRDCKARYGSAHLHSIGGGTSFAVTLAPDPSSSLWLSAAVIEA